MQSKSNCVSEGPPGKMDKQMDDTALERICDTIFTLIPEVPRLKQLFQSWCQLAAEERIQLDAKVSNWCNFHRKRLYKPLREALVRWESVQDTQGAPGCEPGIVSFSCDPQLEEELVNVICSLELIFTRRNTPLRQEQRRRQENDEEEEEVEEEEENDEEEEEEENEEEEDVSLMVNGQEYLRNVLSAQVKASHSVHSCSYINDRRNSDDEFNGYITN